MGEALPDWTRILAAGADIDLAAAVHGGYVVDASDRFFGEPRNMLMPYPAREHGRRLGDQAPARPGPRLGRHPARRCRATIRRIELDTAHFKGNYPDTAVRRGGAWSKDERGGVSADVSDAGDRRTGRPSCRQAKLQPDHLHVVRDGAGAGSAVRRTCG